MGRCRAAILALPHAAYAAEAGLYGDGSIPRLMQWLEELQAKLRRSLVIKAMQDGRPVGSGPEHGAHRSAKAALKPVPYLGPKLMLRAWCKSGISW